MLSVQLNNNAYAGVELAAKISSTYPDEEGQAHEPSGVCEMDVPSASAVSRLTESEESRPEVVQRAESECGHSIGKIIG